MITTYTEYLDEIHQAIRAKPIGVFISSFNLNTGVSARGTTYPSPTFGILSQLNRDCPGGRILIGPPAGRADFTQCVGASQEQWPKLKFRTLDNLHLKCWIFKYKKYTTALAGGRNLGDSQWHDASWWLNQKDSKSLLEFYLSLWEKAQPVRVVHTPALEITIGGKRVI
jgi:hypothetical protein